MLAAEGYPGMCCDVFAPWSWLLPLNVSVLTRLTHCEPPGGRGWGGARGRAAPSQVPGRGRSPTEDVPGGGERGARGGARRRAAPAVCRARVFVLLRQQWAPSCVYINLGAVVVFKKSKSKPTISSPQKNTPKPKYHPLAPLKSVAR